MSNQAKYDSLRATFESFIYEDFHYSVENGEFSAVFDFVLKPYCHFERSEAESRNPLNVEFHPNFKIPSRSFYHWNDIPKPLLDNIIFNIGMIELISYWKIACPKQVIVKPFALDEEQIRWWKKLYFNGLGEFFYVNGIKTDINEFMTLTSFRAERSAVEKSPAYNLLHERTLIPVGGGKDSVVTLELLKNRIPAIPLIINPRGATRDCVTAAGYTEEQTAIIKRTLDPTMLKMNAEGYLNGHTPFSAMLAFYTVLLGFATKSKYIALSNESSANEPTVPDTEINHQYSKSVAFENDFRDYVKKYIDTDIQYFSFLRPLNELQIARFFSRANDYHKVFRSCNAGSKTDSWCGKCPKCLFTWLALSPFLKRSELTDIFGKDLLKDNDLRHTLYQLDGSVEVKPFECVGTVGEVRACVNKILQTDDNLRDTILDGVAKTDDMTVEDYVAQYDEGNNLPELFENIMKEALHG
ncbi:MAG: hypothetical protein J6W12_08055 [Bacteroidales bacterium]|nr:hypothetical protein [Bacteroidales bacterium]